MKKHIATFAFLLFAAATFAQNGLTNVFVQRNINGDQISFNVILGGPGANDVSDMEITFSNGTDCRICTTTILPMSPSVGNTWAGGGQGSNAFGLFDLGIITIEHSNGDITRWEIAFQLGTGSRTTSSQSGNKAELL